MKRYLLTLLLLVVAVLLQSGVPGVALFGGLKPPLLIAMVVHYALRREKHELWVFIILASLVHDGLEMGTFGPALLTFPFVGMGVQRIRGEVFVDGLITHVILGGLAGLILSFVTAFIFTASGQRPLFIAPVLARCLGGFVLGGIVLPILSQLIIRLEALIPKPRSFGWQ